MIMLGIFVVMIGICLLDGQLFQTGVALICAGALLILLGARGQGRQYR